MDSHLAQPQKAQVHHTPRLMPARGNMRAPVHLFTGEYQPLSITEQMSLEAVASLAPVAQVAALPDLHVKPQLETPSSIATATRESIVLALSSPSPGCGMALALTRLDQGDLDSDRVDRLFSELVRRLPLHGAGRAPLVEDIRPVLLQGAPAALNQFGLDPALVRVIDHQGSAFRPGELDGQPGEILDTLPASLLPLATQEFGTVGRGNHFLELQIIDEVIDPALASAWDLYPGQVVIMYHADSGRLGALVGRLYAHRRKNNLRGRVMELRIKSAFHLAKIRSLQEAYHRVRFYFLPRPHQVLPVESREARQALLATGAAMNYAFANRVAILAALSASLQGVWGEWAGAPDLLVDLSHNSIRPEEIRGEPLWIHRHNTSPAYPAGHAELLGGPYEKTGRPILLPGTNQTSSYICVAAPGVENSLYSVDHGAGRTAQQMAHPLSPEASSTRLYDYSGKIGGMVEHRSSRGVDQVCATLQHFNLAKPVVRLRPYAVLKDSSR